MKKIMIVEDEEKISEVIASFLTSKGYGTLVANTGTKALAMLENEVVSLVLLDLMLPELSGEEVCRRIRLISRVPIIMLTAKSSEPDLLHGLDIGADDYITKPFSLKALHARIEAVLRRSTDDLVSLQSKLVIDDGALVIDFNARKVTKLSQEVRLTPNEYKILAALAKYPNKVFTRDELIVTALGDDFLGFDRAIDSHIKNLRQKIELDPKNPIYVKTVFGVGYRFGGGK
ncbi:MAG: DNA-binding response regulator [Firmicutes bacterium HGW-Firmicutes-11]|jgi:DNA-binding response OmpR family regulator|nr:MAG: DNA-binding response regulator [Firmicutes bacterium HGW-Firmicutes-11]